MNDFHTAALNICSDLGVIYHQVPIDGKFHPLDVQGKPQRNGAGRIRPFPDGEGGQIWNHVTGASKIFWLKSDSTLSASEKVERNKRTTEERVKAEQMLAEEQAAAAVLAGKVILLSKPAQANNPYLSRKQTPPTDNLGEIPLIEIIGTIGYHPGVKGEPLNGISILVVPIKDIDGNLTSIEMIDEAGRKPALAKGRKKGCFWSTTSDLPESDGTGLMLGIGEGVADMLTWNMATDCVGIAALSSNNLKEVAQQFRKRYPKTTIYIIADIGNGYDKAAEAAKLISGILIKPILERGSSGTDLNDLMVESGLEEVKHQIAATTETSSISDGIGTRDEPLAAAVIRLAKLTQMEYDQIRTVEAKAMGVRPVTLDDEVKAARKKGVSSDMPFKEVEPWPEHVDGAELVTELVTTIRRFIVCEQHTAIAAALWIAMAWFMDVVMVAPLAIITAPEKRCGKTLLLALIGKLTPKTLPASSITPSALFRSVDLWRPTLLIDETDACLKDNEELRGLINCGHTRDSAFVVRCVGDDHTPTKFNVWAAKALAGIGHVADTMMDRAIILELRRKLPTEKVERIRHAEPALFQELSSKLARFAQDNSESVRLARPVLPQSLNDRAQDNWEPLLSIAMVAGGDWYKSAVKAVLKIAGSEDSSPTVGVELLADIQEIFQSKKIDRVRSSELIQYLVADEEQPWATYNRGFPIKPRQISFRLKGYGIHSKTIRIETGTAKGYEKDQFKEAFSRYIPSSPSLSVTESQPAPVQGLRDKSMSNNGVSVTDDMSDKQLDFNDCYLVTDKIHLLGNEEVLDLSGTEFEVVR